MSGFFDSEGMFAKIVNMIIDTIYLSVLWVVFSLPILTVGAATSAMFYVATKRVSNRESYIFRDFVKAFKENFLRATALWLTQAAFMALDLAIIRLALSRGIALAALTPVCTFVLLELSALALYAYPLTARFKMDSVELLKTSFIMVHKHIITTIACLALTLALIFAVFIHPLVIFAGVGAYALLTSFLITKVFRMYRPDFDA